MFISMINKLQLVIDAQFYSQQLKYHCAWVERADLLMCADEVLITGFDEVDIHV